MNKLKKKKERQHAKLAVFGRMFTRMLTYTCSHFLLYNIIMFKLLIIHIDFSVTQTSLKAIDI